MDIDMYHVYRFDIEIISFSLVFLQIISSVTLLKYKPQPISYDLFCNRRYVRLKCLQKECLLWNYMSSSVTPWRFNIDFPKELQYQFLLADFTGF